MSTLYKENAGLAKKIVAERKYEKEQQELKEKHHFTDADDVVVVEKPSLLKFIITVCIQIIKVAACICILMLATIGLMSLIYPEPRSEIIEAFHGIFREIRYLIGLS